MDSSQPDQQAQNSVSPTRHKREWIENNIAPFLIGTLAGIVGMFIYQKHLEGITKVIFNISLFSFGVLVATFLLFFGFKKYITRYLFGNKAANAEDFIEDTQRISDALTEQLANKLLADAPEETKERVRFILPKMANWFIWSRLRNWWWQWVLGIFISLGGLTGTLLLMNQNKLIQNQMYQNEAMRIGSLVVLMSNIMDKVDREISVQQGINPQQKEFNLSQSLIGQIAALSHSFKPYKFLKGDNIIGKELSPERGQLLITLANLPLDTITFDSIFKKSTFGNADLEAANLSGAYLRKTYLMDANLNEADLSSTKLSGAILSGADLSSTKLSGAKLNFGILYGANLSEANLSEADLSEAKLSGANLSGALLSRADLSGAKLNFGNFMAADLSKADLSGAFLGGVDMTIKQAQTLKTLYNCSNLHDRLKIELQKTNPELFEEPNYKH
jgi:uncharacterized protein YjbI with pentapeptide repeats